MPRYIIGNWKMNLLSAEAEALARELRDQQVPLGVTAGVAPVALHLAAVARELASTRWIVGAQNCADRGPGALTGEIAPSQLKDAGASFVIIGHSERRHILKERSTLINAKIRAAMSAGLTPLVCIGETGPEREQGLTGTILDEQLRGAFLDFTAAEVEKCLLAYEPVWAIGTGVTAKPDQIAEAHERVRKQLGLGYGQGAADLPILYGGSVNADNAAEILGISGVDGCLVGGASLRAGDFTQILSCG